MTARQSVVRVSADYLRERKLEPTIPNIDRALSIFADAYPGDSAENAYLEGMTPFAWVRLYRDIFQATKMGQSE